MRKTQHSASSLNGPSFDKNSIITEQISFTKTQGAIFSEKITRFTDGTDDVPNFGRCVIFRVFCDFIFWVIFYFEDSVVSIVQTWTNQVRHRGIDNAKVFARVALKITKKNKMSLPLYYKIFVLF